MHISLASSQLLLQKDGQINLAYEAYTLRILTLGRSQLLLGSDGAHLGF